MNTLDLILARTNLSLTIEKMRNSLNDIEAKNPHRTDLISSMQKSISDLTFSYIYFCELETEYRVSRQRNGDLQYNRLKDMESLKELKGQIDEMKKYL